MVDFNMAGTSSDISSFTLNAFSRLIILLVLLFGGGFFGYSRYGTGGGMGIGGVILVILLVWLFLGGGLGNLRM